MLDDCKGEKFEQVLLLFSTAVVRKQLLSNPHKHHVSIGRALCVTNNLDKRDMDMLAPLSMAYRASLTKTLQSRVTLKHTLDDFRATLYEKRNAYHERHLTLLESQDSTQEALSPDAEKSIRRELRQNWLGSTEGCDALLAGAETTLSDAYMDSDFEDLWQHFQHGTNPHMKLENMSLLKTLHSRVMEQSDRLRLWQSYKDVFDGSSETGVAVPSLVTPSSGNATAAECGLDIFNKHKDIRSEPAKPGVLEDYTPDFVADYGHIVRELEQDILKVVKQKRRQHDGAHRATATTPAVGKRYQNTMPKEVLIPVLLAGSREPQPDFFSPLKRPLLMSTNTTPVALRDEPHKTHSTIPRTHSQPASTSRPVQDIMDEQFEQSVNSQRKHIDAEDDAPVSSCSAETVPAIALNNQQDDSITQLEDQLDHLELRKSRQPSSTLILPEHSPSPLPSSTPHEAPTLSERARLSMTSSHRESSSDEPTDSRIQSPPTDSRPILHDTDTIIRRSSLTERCLSTRTQAGIATIKQQQQRPHSSFFPATTTITTAETSPHSSTPMKKKIANKTAAGARRDITPRAKLFEQDAEYASIFKSRPKIATSPVLSPQFDDNGEMDNDELSFERGGMGRILRGLQDDDDLDNHESLVYHGLQSSPLGDRFGRV
jgi:hypothetical protein